MKTCNTEVEKQLYRRNKAKQQPVKTKVQYHGICSFLYV